ncbi:MAG TPA: T9SS type A sorting domain-containing protein [Rhodothermales bacterium]|nr:T9SS type A sorting domain-containing protein [Rhodothermales bacterium]
MSTKATIFVLVPLFVLALAPQSVVAQAQGACCEISSGACQVVGNQNACEEAQTGVFQGIGTTCDPNPCEALPVELVSFTAKAIESGTVQLAWQTASEINNAGFDVEREVGSGLFEKIDFVQGHGTTTEPQAYSYTVRGLDPGQYTFRLKQIDLDGAFAYSGQVEAIVEVPGQFLLKAAYPNPFNPSTTVSFAVSQKQSVALKLYDTTGRQLRVLFEGTPEANSLQSVRIDGSGLSSGMYVVRLEGASFSESQEIVLLK